MNLFSEHAQFVFSIISVKNDDHAHDSRDTSGLSQYSMIEILISVIDDSKSMYSKERQHGLDKIEEKPTGNDDKS